MADHMNEDQNEELWKNLDTMTPETHHGLSKANAQKRLHVTNDSMIEIRNVHDHMISNSHAEK